MDEWKKCGSGGGMVEGNVTTGGGGGKKTRGRFSVSGERSTSGGVVPGSSGVSGGHVMVGDGGRGGRGGGKVKRGGEESVVMLDGFKVRPRGWISFVLGFGNV